MHNHTPLYRSYHCTQKNKNGGWMNVDAITCPICQQPTTIPENGLHGLTANIDLQQEVEMYSKGLCV